MAYSTVVAASRHLWKRSIQAAPAGATDARTNSSSASGSTTTARRRARAAPRPRGCRRPRPAPRRRIRPCPLELHGELRRAAARPRRRGAPFSPGVPILWPQKCTTAGPASRGKHGRVGPGRLADEPQLAARRREGAVVVVVARHTRARSHRARHQAGRARGRPRPPWPRRSTTRLRGARAGRGRPRRTRARFGSPATRLSVAAFTAGYQPPVRAWIAAYSSAERAAARRRSAPSPPRAMSFTMRARRCHVLGIDLGQAELAKAARGLVRRAGACQREHRPVPEPEIVRVLFEGALGEIEGGEQLSTPLGVADGFGPFDGRTLGRSSIRPTCARPLPQGGSHAWPRRSSRR